jgi:hypothetical protein
MMPGRCCPCPDVRTDSWDCPRPRHPGLADQEESERRPAQGADLVLSTLAVQGTTSNDLAASAR